jgi:hypothetical protein
LNGEEGMHMSFDKAIIFILKSSSSTLVIFDTHVPIDPSSKRRPYLIYFG